MQKLIKNLLTDKAIYIALFVSVLILILSLIPVHSKLLGEIKNFDKIIHTIFYTVLCLSWLFYFKPLKNLKLKLSVGLGLIIYGIIIEVLQEKLTTYRTGSFFDALANTIGILIGILLFEKLYKIIIK